MQNDTPPKRGPRTGNGNYCPTDSVVESLLRHLELAESGCWLWTGLINAAGYGVVPFIGPGITVLVHRLAFMAFVGPIPDELTIDHLC